ncbi:MAG: nucleotidyltransferase domain-containing protein [Methylococcales symbiont of Iophon sp. n. MRB-2018]|nr:MAG: nucleotidyltransferase domain-containing protein [Methylococcales symbiont of Iophon sp. n. MRB-2018]KAF3980525.1 MAG: nucleotidyltransferase domain-containing protein [Methylococcales symbiont of Iophon sp. n. MRB-2018]
MRLSKQIINILNHCVQQSFGDIEVYLFGSRVDDNKRGGDIDLAIKTNLTTIEFRRKKILLLSQLLKKDFPLKVDIVAYNNQDPLLKQEIHNNAIKLF